MSLITEIRDNVSAILRLRKGNFYVSSAKGQQLWINCYSYNGDIIACDVFTDTNSKAEVYFFFRSATDNVTIDSDAEISCKEYWDSIRNSMPRGYSPTLYNGVGYRLHKAYSEQYSPKEIVREIIEVYRALGACLSQ